MKHGLIIAVGLLCCQLLSGQRSAPLPHPDHYPADSIIVLLREDTIANQFKAWVINRTDSTLTLNAPYGLSEDWLEVKDGEDIWRVYNSFFPKVYACSIDLSYKHQLRKNGFIKASFIRTHGKFQTLARGRFTLDGVTHYSPEISVSIDTTDFLHPDLRIIAQIIRENNEKGSKRQSRLQYFRGTLMMQKKRYGEADENFKEALRLDSTNYRAIIALGDVKTRLASKAGLNESEMSKVIKSVFESYRVIPKSEEELQRNIERRRKSYTKWL